MLHETATNVAGTPCSPPRSYPAPSINFDDAVKLARGALDLNRATQRLLSAMTRPERLSLLDGDEAFWSGLRSILFDRYNRSPFVMGAVPRLKIPGIRFTDGPRGIVLHSSTCFPVSMARGATWDIALEERIGHAIGLEGRAQGANYFAGICINLPRHPAWGRVQETYGEDPILLGEFGLALHRGVRGHLMTCVKHFALNSMENARFHVDVQVDDAALHEVYLPHFRQLVEGGVSSVMSSYNSVRGEFAGENAQLLNDILRTDWNFQGFVLSDFIFGLRNAAKSVKNGLDIEAPFTQQRAMNLAAALEDGSLAWSDVDRACARVLRVQIEHAVRTGNAIPGHDVVFCDQHRKLAREAAAQSMVLLKNESVLGSPVLPMDASKLTRVAVIGRLANKANLGDKGSSAVYPPQVTTFYQGLQQALPGAEVLLVDGDSACEAEEAASSADFVVCVVGYDAADEGEFIIPSFADHQELLDLLPPALTSEDMEVRDILSGRVDKSPDKEEPAGEGMVPGSGGDRKSLRLRDRDVDIIRAVAGQSSRFVVSVVGAGAIIMEEWLDLVPAVLLTWYSGGEGGHALADVLLGRVDASGRLPFAVPKSEKHLPDFSMDASSVVYDRWHGQRLLDRLGVAARYPLGFGLSYSQFAIADLKVDTSLLGFKLDRFVVQCTLSNQGTRAGRHVIQVYALNEAPDFPSRVLLGFGAFALNSNESTRVSIVCSTRPLEVRRRASFAFVDGVIGIEVGAYAGDLASLQGCMSLQL